jgi:hypothetical protein
MARQFTSGSSHFSSSPPGIRASASPLSPLQFSCNKEFLLMLSSRLSLSQVFLHEISHPVLFFVLVSFIRTTWRAHCSLLNWIYFTVGGPSNSSNASQLYLACILSYFHRPARRFFLEFSFQTLLAFLLMTQSLSMLHSNSLVLVESKSCTFWIDVFCVTEKCTLLPDKCFFCSSTSSSFGLVNSVPTSFVNRQLFQYPIFPFVLNI